MLYEKNILNIVWRRNLDMNEKRYIQFSYQIHNGKVPFKTWMQLNYYKMLLRIKRTLRFGKRLLLHLRKYIPILTCVILFECLIVPLGIKLNKYESWIDGLWDLRVFMLTSIIISVFTRILNEELKRQKELKKQYEVYESFKYDSEKFIELLCDIIGMNVEENVFQTESGFIVFCKQLNCYLPLENQQIRKPIIKNCDLLYSTGNLKRLVVLTIAIKQYIHKLTRINETIVQHEFEGTIEHCIEQIDYIYNEVLAEMLLIEEKKDNYSDVQLLRFIDVISRCIYPAIADIRRPWRWDIKINIKMRDILKIDTDNDV